MLGAFGIIDGGRTDEVSSPLFWIVISIMLAMGFIGIPSVLIRNHKEKKAKQKTIVNETINKDIANKLHAEEIKMIFGDNSIKEEDVINSPLHTYKFKRIKGKYSYEITDENEKRVCISYLKDNVPFKKNVVIFENCLKRTKIERAITSGMLVQDSSYSANHFTSMYFRMEDLKVWDYLDKLEVAIKYFYRQFHVFYQNKDVATIDVDKKFHIYLRNKEFTIQCKEAYLDFAFLSTFIISFGCYASSYYLPHYR